jgi:hypothetical protein
MSANANANAGKRRGGGKQNAAGGGKGQRFELTDEQKLEIREAFDLFDTDGSGALLLHAPVRRSQNICPVAVVAASTFGLGTSIGCCGSQLPATAYSRSPCLVMRAACDPASLFLGQAPSTRRS